MKIYLFKAMLWGLHTMLWPFIYDPSPPAVHHVYKNLKYGVEDNQVLDIFTPEGSGKRPLLLWLHGGGFLSGDKAYYYRICREFASKGLVVFNVNYRLSPQAQYPDQVRDVHLAVQWALGKARDFGGDPAALFLAGDSAGANLAATYAALADDSALVESFDINPPPARGAIRGLLLFYGVYDLVDLLERDFPYKESLLEAFMGPDKSSYQRRTWLASPQLHLTAGFPPCFVSAGEIDFAFYQSQRFCEALEARGVPHAKLFFAKMDYPSANHAFLNFYRREPAREAMKQAFEFIDGLGLAGLAHTGDSPPLFIDALHR
ncbi:MAG: alpha/beta hydrolase [Pseudomonadota bacterium]